MTTPNRAIGLRLAAAASGAPYWQMLRGTVAPILTPKVVALSATLVTAVQTELLLIKSATLGTPTAPVFSNRLYDPGAGDTDQARFASAWSVLPTIGAATTALARITLPGAIGATVTWEFGDGELEIQDTESLLLWNVGGSAGAQLDVTCFFQGN